MILEFKNVTGKTKHFNLQDVSFALEPGFIMGLAGKNGAGKSTLIDYIMNPKQQYTGEILIEGVNIRDKHYHMMNRIGFISDNNTGFLYEKTAKENMEIFGPLYDDWDDVRFFKAMQKMNLSPGKIVGKMSRGELFKFQNRSITSPGLCRKIKGYLYFPAKPFCIVGEGQCPSRKEIYPSMG